MVGERKGDGERSCRSREELLLIIFAGKTRLPLLAIGELATKAESIRCRNLEISQWTSIESCNVAPFGTTCTIDMQLPAHAMGTMTLYSLCYSESPLERHAHSSPSVLTGVGHGLEICAFSFPSTANGAHDPGILHLEEAGLAF